MKLIFKWLGISLVIATGITASANPDVFETFRTVVDSNGNISLPLEYRRSWSFLGTWSVAKAEAKPGSAVSEKGAAALHNVYVQPDAITAFKQSGEFPDGTVLIKELLKTTTDSMTTGTVSFGHDVEGWFVMVKDRHDRFPDHPLWGGGWGWALIDATAPETTVTKDYKTECVGCHIPAQNTDWIYIKGYPVLNAD